MTLKMCTLYKGVPNGIAQISFKHPTDKDESFEGVGVFTDGRLHMGPFTCLRGDGVKRSYSLMIDGRPADSHYYTEFFSNGNTRNVESLKTSTDVSSYQVISSQMQQAEPHGEGKRWLTKGRIFIGDSYRFKMHSGKLYEMQADNTFTLYNVQYDAQKDNDNQIYPNN